MLNFPTHAHTFVACGYIFLGVPDAECRLQLLSPLLDLRHTEKI